MGYVSEKQVREYLQRQSIDKLKKISSEATDVLAGKPGAHHHQGQLTAAIMVAKSHLQKAAVVQPELTKLHVALDDFPLIMPDEFYNPFALLRNFSKIKTLMSRQFQLQSTLFSHMQEVISTVHLPSYPEVLKSIHFLLLAVKHELEGDGPITQFGITVIDAEQRKKNLETVERLVGKLLANHFPMREKRGFFKPAANDSEITVEKSTITFHI